MVAGIGIIVIVLLVACALGGLAAESGSSGVLAELRNPLTASIIRFTLWQSTLSTLLSIALALPLARALARRGDFPGRGVLLRLSSISLVIPNMVAVLGIVAVYGRHGWISQWLVSMGLARFEHLYGLVGILIAHVFFNLPLATRIFLNGLLAIPQHSWNLALLYGMRPWHVFRHLELPLLCKLIPGVAGMVFLLCFTSFAIVLTLGGGPKSTTLEVAIYQAVRFDFDLSRAVALSLIQIAICLLLSIGFFFRGASFPLSAADYPGNHRPDRTATLPRLIDGVVIAAASVFLLTPLLAVLMKALSADGWSIIYHESFWQALRWTVVIALPAGLLSCLLALSVCNVTVALRRSRRFSRYAVGAEICGLLTLLAPPITLGTGLFLFFHRVLEYGDALSLGPILLVALNALFSVAFAIRILVPALHTARARYDQLCAMLGIRGWHRWHQILWHSMRRPFMFALAVTTTLAAGDMGVIALFGTDSLSTLPLLMYRLIGSYQLSHAAVVAVVLCMVCFILFWVIEFFGESGGESGDQSHDPSRGKLLRRFARANTTPHA